MRGIITGTFGRKESRLMFTPELSCSYNYIANRERAQPDNTYFRQLCYDSVQALKHSGVAYVFQQAQVDKIKIHLEPKYRVDIAMTDGIFVIRATKRG